MNRCRITLETVADYYEGRADGSAALQMRQHLEAGCPTCEENLAWLESIASPLRAAIRVEVPSSLLDRAHALFIERFRVPDRPSILARMRFDSRAITPFALAHARSVDTDHEGQNQAGYELIYETDGYDIDLYLEPTAQGTWYLIGQVLPKDEDQPDENRIIMPREVILTFDDRTRIAITPTADEFHIAAVKAGGYEMVLRLPDRDLVLSGITVGR